MADAGFVLVAGPFTGPFAWSRVAAVLRARGRRVAVHDADDPIAPPIVLAGHSGAGSRLPAIAQQLGGVQHAVFVDALLPHPGRSWAQTVPPELVAKLESQAVDGRLPRWPEWWGEAAMRALLPEDGLRARFVAECPSVPVALLHEVMPDVPVPPATFVQLSATYESETAAARELGWATVVLDLHHLALLTAPDVVVDALLAV
jgi:hypothetical protein